MSDSSSDSESEKKLDTNLPISSIDEAKESEIEDVTFSKLVYLRFKLKEYLLFKHRILWKVNLKLQ